GRVRGEGAGAVPRDRDGGAGGHEAGAAQRPSGAVGSWHRPRLLRVARHRPRMADLAAKPERLRGADLSMTRNTDRTLARKACALLLAAVLLVSGRASAQDAG